jgi:trehalose/maltose transport system permease protein
MTAAASPAARLFALAQRLAFWAVVLLFVFYSASPFYWAINTALKTDAERAQYPATAIPQQPTTDNFARVLDNQDFLVSIVNSALVALGATLLSVAVGGLAAYALGRFNFRGRRMMRYVILLMSLFPTIAVLPSLFILITDLGLSGSILSLILTYPIFTLPGTTWTLIVFFRNLPPDIEQAAFVDGANTFQLFVRVLMPISAPVLLTSGLITFVGVWSEYLLALAFTAADKSARTVTVAIKFLAGQLTPGELMAASVLLSIPLMLVIFYTQRRFITNTTEGAVKG